MSDPMHTGVVTLGDLVAESTLGVQAVTHETRLNRQLNFVYPTELEDPGLYLRGGELILTVGMPLVEVELVSTYIRGLCAGGVVALGLGLGERFQQPPRDLVDACTNADLTLLTVAPEHPFRAIVDWVNSRREHERDIAQQEQDLGSLLEWCVAGTLGVGPVEDLLARHALDRVPVLVCASPLESHAEMHVWAERCGAVVARLKDTIVALAEQSDGALARVRDSGVACGISTATSPRELSRAIQEAMEALRVARTADEVIHVRETVTLDGLLASVPSVRLVPFVQRFVAPLVDYDRKHRSQLVATIAAFLANDTNSAATSAQLYVHANTLRNRLLKIHELTSADPYSEETRIGFRVALWAARRWGMRNGSAELECTPPPASSTIAG